MLRGIRFARCSSADGAWKTHNLAAAGGFLAPEACCGFFVDQFRYKADKMHMRRARSLRQGGNVMQAPGHPTRCLWTKQGHVSARVGPSPSSSRSAPAPAPPPPPPPSFLYQRPPFCPRCCASQALCFTCLAWSHISPSWCPTRVSRWLSSACHTTGHAPSLRYSPCTIPQHVHGLAYSAAVSHPLSDLSPSPLFWLLRDFSDPLHIVYISFPVRYQPRPAQVSFPMHIRKAFSPFITAHKRIQLSA